MPWAPFQRRGAHGTRRGFRRPGGRSPGQRSTTSLSPSMRLPVTFALTKLAIWVTLAPGESQYSAESALTLMRMLFGFSGPPSSHAPVKEFHSSASLAVSSTIVAVSDSDTHELCEL